MYPAPLLSRWCGQWWDGGDEQVLTGHSQVDCLPGNRHDDHSGEDHNSSHSSQLTQSLSQTVLVLASSCLESVFSQQDFAAQYHIQTDLGEDRFFRFQTHTGQYRKEILRPDGSQEGTYGWVDPNGVLRLFDYIADGRHVGDEKVGLSLVHCRAGLQDRQGESLQGRGCSSRLSSRHSWRRH